MAHRLRTATLTAALAAGVFLTGAGTAAAAPPSGGHGGHHQPIEVVAQGLADPFGLSARGGKFYVAESGAERVTGFRAGRAPSVRWPGLPAAPTGVDRTRTELLVVTGAGEQDGAMKLWASKPGGPPRLVADLLAHELAENPDGQPQFAPDGTPYDAVSNPVAVLGGRGHGTAYAYVADGGANDVLAVDRDGTVRTLFAPPTVTTGACEGAPNANPDVVGCDPVPTGLAWGPDGNLYVSGLSAEVPGEGRVYVVDPRTGDLVRTITGLDAPTGVAVGDDGSVYVSEVLEGLVLAGPDQPPAPPEDPSAIGQVVRVAPDGARSSAQVTMPLGLRWADGALYSTAWSVAGQFLQQQGAGQVVRVDASAFSAVVEED